MRRTTGADTVPSTSPGPAIGPGRCSGSTEVRDLEIGELVLIEDFQSTVVWQGHVSRAAETSSR